MAGTKTEEDAKMAKLYFKYGAMGSSKSAQALITKFNYEELGMQVWLIKPSIDDRDGADIVKSRIGLSCRAKVVTPEDAHVGVGVHKNFDVQKVAQRLVLQNEDALYQNHRGGADGDGVGGAVVNGVVVGGALHRAPGAQLLKIADHALGFKGVGAVIVEAGALLIGEVVVGAVVVVVVDDADAVAEKLLELLRDGGFPAAGAAGDADGDDVAHGEPLPPRFTPADSRGRRQLFGT